MATRFVIAAAVVVLVLVGTMLGADAASNRRDRNTLILYSGTTRRPAP